MQLLLPIYVFFQKERYLIYQSSITLEGQVASSSWTFYSAVSWKQYVTLLIKVTVQNGPDRYNGTQIPDHQS